MSFIASLRRRWTDADTLLCVGLDPEPEKFPAALRADPDAVFAFCRAIVDATADAVCAFKPQIAHFAALGAEDALRRLIAHIHAAHPGVPVILDICHQRYISGHGWMQTQARIPTHLLNQIVINQQFESRPYMNRLISDSTDHQSG
jgi:hypothetical protein